MSAATALSLPHKDVNRNNKDIQNIQLLCRDCYNGIHSSARGRKSLAEEYYKETLEEEDEERGTWLVIYDFSSKPNPRFWRNIKRRARIRTGRWGGTVQARARCGDDHTRALRAQGGGAVASE